MDSNNLSLITNEITNEYDDGVVCFGPVTEDQINRYKRLPRRTVLPSDFELSQSVFESGEDKENDKSIVLDVSNENTTMCYDNSVNMTQSTNNFDEDKEEIGTFQLKQSISEDSNLRFSSPCSSKCIPNAKLIDTEVINRYIRMGSISSNESSLSENQNKSTFEDETISFTDPRESELIQNNYDYNETNSCEHLSVSSIIEQNPSINQQNVLDDSNNVCTLIHCSQEDDTDLSICSDVELGDVSEDSICADEYSITPGKQRLFDLRVTKQSLRAKTLKASAPFMDRIEETTTPVLPKVIDSPFILDDISNKHTETKNGLNGSSITELSHETSTELFNQTSNENVFEITKLIEETTGELLISNNLEDTNFLNECAGTKFDEEANNRSMHSNQSLNETVHIQSILNDTEPKIDDEKSMNTMSNMANPTYDVNDYNDEEYSVPMEVDIKSSNTSVVDTLVDEPNILSTNDQNMSLNKSLNDIKQKFNDEKSMKTSSDMANLTCDVNDYNNEEYSVPMEVDIKSSNTSVVDTLVDEPYKLLTNNQNMSLNKSLNDTEQQFDDEKSVCIMPNVTVSQGISTSCVNDHYVEGNSINMNIADKVFNETMNSSRHSANNQSTDLNNTNHIESTINDPQHKFDDEKSMNTTSNTSNSTSDVNDNTNEEYSVPIEVDIKSSNTSVLDTIVDETMYTSKLPTNDQSMSLNKSLYDTKQQFDDEKSVCIMSNVTIPQGISTSCVNDHYDEGNSINMNITDKVFDETMYSNRLSANNQSINSNKSLNNTQQKCDDEKSLCIMTNVTVSQGISTSRVNDHYVEGNSLNTSREDKIFDETVYANRLSANNQSTDLNNTNHIEITINGPEHKFNDEKSMNTTSNMANSALDVNDYNDEEYSVPIEVDIKSSNTSIVDTIVDEITHTSKLPTNYQSMSLNKSLNDTKQKFDDEKSINTSSNINNPTPDDNDYNDVEFTVSMGVNINSSNTSVVDTKIDETMYTNRLSAKNMQSMDLNKSLNRTNCIESILNDTEHKFDNDEEYSVPMEVDIKSSNTSIVDTLVDEPSILPINDQSTNLNESLNDTKHQFDDEKSICIMSNVTISQAMSTSDVNDHYDEGNSINMNIADKVFDETIYTNRLSANSKSMDLNKSLNQTKHIESILNNTEHKFDDKKSMDSMSNMVNPTPDVNDFKDEECSVPMEVGIKSSDTSVMDTKIDETICTSTLPTNNSGVDFKESLNDTICTSNDSEHRLIKNIQNTNVPTIHLEEKLHSSKLNKSMLKNTTISDSCFVESNEVNITCNTTLEDPSCMMRQYLDFEQAVNEICEDITSASCPSRKLNLPKASYDDETLERLIEQTLTSDTFDSTKINENVSSYNGSNLSVIIENTSLETSSNNLEQNEDILNPNTDLPIISESESIVNEIENNEVLNTSAVENTVESTVAPKSEMGILNEKDIHMKIKANESISMNCTITDSGLVENINETKNNEGSVIHDDLSERDKQFDSITTKQLLVPENNEKMHSNQINSTDIPNSAAFKLIPETEKTDKNFFDQDDIFNNDNQPDSLDFTKSNNTSLEEFTNLEQMFNFGDNQKEKQVEYKTPKTQKLLDFSIVQQTPTFDNQAKKQKLLNFSIVDQTPLKSAQTYPNENIINSDSLINFSSIDQMWNSEIAPKDEINYRDLQNSSSNNLSTISSPDVELLADESIKINTSQFSNSSFNQTITDSNLNLSPYSCTSNKTQNNIIELNNVEPLVLVNKQSLVDSLSNSLNQTIKQDESEQKKIFNKHYMLEESTKEVKLLSSITLNKSIDSDEVTEDSNHKLCTNSNKDAIVDFSIIDQGLLENVDLKNNTAVMSVDSDRNLSNLIEMSLVSIPVNKSDEKPVVLSENPIEVKTSDNGSKTSINSSSNEINSTTLQFEESPFLHNNTELLTDIQMNDESLLTETPEKSSIIDSFHSIELDHVQEDNKRKIDTIQEYDNSEKKMKVETETLKTPMSMLYKIKNMFRSSEKQLSCVNNTKENNLKSGKCYQKLNFGKFEENNDNFTKPTSLKKSEIPTKSKIPCKVTDRSSKNDEFNNSSLSSLNDSIKQKKTIPKFSGVPVLSDVSNSSNRKCTESRIPSKFQK